MSEPANPFAAPDPTRPGAPAGQQTWGGQQAWGSPPGWEQPGKIRDTGACIVLAVVTLSVYIYVYNHKVHKEMKAHSGRGVGGGVALLLTLLAGIAMPFVTSAEVGGLYDKRGDTAPVSGRTGLWVLVPMVLGYLVLVAAVFAAALGATAQAVEGGAASSGGASFAAGFLAFLLIATTGAVVWFVKTNGALNRYWASLGAF